MNANTTSVTAPHEYQVSFDATIPNAHPTAKPDERQRVALSRPAKAWSALDAANQVKMEVEREYRLDKSKPSWKDLNGVTPLQQQEPLLTPPRQEAVGEYECGPFWFVREPYGEQEAVILLGDKEPEVTKGTVGRVFGNGEGVCVRYPNGQFSLATGLALLPGQMMKVGLRIVHLPNSTLVQLGEVSGLDSSVEPGFFPDGSNWFPKACRFITGAFSFWNTWKSAELRLPVIARSRGLKFWNTKRSHDAEPGVSPPGDPISWIGTNS